VELGITANRLSPSARSSFEDTLAKFELVNGKQLTNAAIVLFGKSTSRLPLQCNMMAARFKGIEKGEFLDHKLITGNAFHILDEGMMFLSRHLPLKGRFEKGKIRRIDEPSIPTEVLREALVNAICHRDYENSGSSIHLAIYDDRVEIISSGGLMPGICISDLKKPHKSILRNPLIARAFYYVGYVEQWGQGTLKMIKLCRDFGLPEPEFIEHPLWFGISFKLSTKKAKSLENILSAKQEKILELLRAYKKLTIKALHNKMPSTPRRTLQWELQLLKDKKMVDTSGQGRLTVWAISQD
jgi:ATP-dependent DNA helicase RecG